MRIKKKEKNLYVDLFLIINMSKLFFYDTGEECEH